MCFSYLELYQPQTRKSRIYLSVAGRMRGGRVSPSPVSLRGVNLDHSPAEWQEPYGAEEGLYPVRL
jgi:hypothetical protein